MAEILRATKEAIEKEIRKEMLAKFSHILEELWYKEQISIGQMHKSLELVDYGHIDFKSLNNIKTD